VLEGVERGVGGGTRRGYMVGGSSSTHPREWWPVDSTPALLFVVR
jgi:hypothetical protein